MFLVLGINELPVSAAFKVNGEEFEELLEREGFTPAPYVAKYKWVKIDHLKRLSKEEWRYFIRRSYNLVKNKLTSKVQKQLGIE